MAEGQKSSPKGSASKPAKPAASQKKTTSEESKKRLYRSKSNRMIGGVCSGVAQHFNFDVTMVRVIWALLVLWGGTGALAYILCWVLVPENPDPGDSPEKNESSSNTGLIWGIILLGLGACFLFNQFDWFDFRPFHFRWHWGRWWPGFRGFDFVFPLLIIGIGVFYLISALKKGNDQAEKSGQSSGGKFMNKKLTRSVKDRMIGGVCGGVAGYFEIDPSIVRVLWAIVTLAGGGIFGVIAYVVMLIVVPEESAVETPGPAPKTPARKAKK